jgi:GNAT superfamily N-acetyltransferase
MSLFASVTVASRIEAAQTQLMAASIAAIRERRPEAQAWAKPVAGGMATLSDLESPLNKITGLGFGGEPEAAELEELEQAYASRGLGVQIELSTLGAPALATMLTRRGYVITGFEDILGRELPAPDVTASSDIAVVRGQPEDFAAWLDALVTGFGTPDTQGVASHEVFGRDALQRVIADVAGADGVTRYVAHLDGVVAGGASLAMIDGVALMTGAATLPDHRRRGVQRALLHTRLQDAAAHDCDLAVATVLPGSKSSRNMQRCGFARLYSRTILVREPNA